MKTCIIAAQSHIGKNSKTHCGTLLFFPFSLPLNKKNPVCFFVKCVLVTSHPQICLSLPFDFMLYLTLDNNFLLMNVFINT